MNYKPPFQEEMHADMHRCRGKKDDLESMSGLDDMIEARQRKHAACLYIKT